MKLRTKLIIFPGIFFLLVVSAIAIAVGYQTNKLIVNQTDDYVYSSSRARAEHIRTFLTEIKHITGSMAKAPVVINFLEEKADTAAVSQRFVESKSIDTHIEEIFLLDLQGKVVASTDQSQLGKDKVNDPYFVEGKKGTYIKDIYFSSTLNKFALAVSSPVKEADTGTLLGVLVFRYDPKTFYNIVGNENGLGDTEENFIINKDKYFITPSRFSGNSVILDKQIDSSNTGSCFAANEVEYVTKNGYSGLRDFLGNMNIVRALDYRGVKSVSAQMYIPETEWCLITKVDEAYTLSPLYTLLAYLLSSLLGGLVLFEILVFYLTNKLISPLTRLNSAIDDTKEGSLPDIKRSERSDEIGSITNSLVKFVAMVKKSRSEVDERVLEQTAALSEKEEFLENQQKAIMNVLEDVSEESAKNQSLADDLKKFEMAVAGASDHIVITDKEGVVLYANKAVEQITGFKSGEVVGMKAGSKELWGGFMPLEVYRDFWNTIKNKKKPFQGIFDNRRKNGQMYEAAANVTPILGKDSEVLYFVGIERDVTKEKEVDRAKTEFVSLASHQLRTPLSAINWYTEMLLAGDAGKINKEQKEYLDEIYRGNQRMVDLVNSLLNVSRLDLGIFQIDPKPIKICEVVEDVADEMKHAMDQKKMLFSNACAIDNPTLQADPKLIRIIIQNLISNAIKYTPEGGKINVAMEYNPKKPKETYIIKVSDNGYGIPSTQKDKIFTKLFRADNIRALDTEGTGLGLYIIKSIMDEAGGTVAFESQENKGTTFTITLPQGGMKSKGGNKSIE